MDSWLQDTLRAANMMIYGRPLVKFILNQMQNHKLNSQYVMLFEGA